MKNAKKVWMAVVVLSLAAAPASAESLYNVIDLGGVLGAHSTQATSINDNGQIVGNAGYPGSPDSLAVLFDTTGKGNNIVLGTLGGDNSKSLSINKT